ncbi:TPA: Panacea domain-containing protein [Streptococcus suis]
MVNIYDVACYILDKKPNITTMKLQKLCYYAQAWSLAWDDVPLFEEDFQAWANGPVCYELYTKHRGHYIAESKLFADFSSGEEFNQTQIDTLDAVIRDYGNDSPHYLSELTHSERPWKETRGSLNLGESSNEIIKKELMQEYYGGLIA